MLRKLKSAKLLEKDANYELVECYSNIGKLIVEAQGGKDKAKYGDALLKEWSKAYCKLCKK